MINFFLFIFAVKFLSVLLTGWEHSTDNYHWER